MTAKRRCLTVPEEGAGQRLDFFLAAEFPELSRSRWQELIKGGYAELDGEFVKRPSARLRGGEKLLVEVVARPPLRATPEEIPLDVLYEDEDVIALNKPAGMVVHLGVGARQGTLVNALLYRFQQLSSLGGELRPGIVHRLDKPTSGVLLVAKNDEAHRRLGEQFAQRTVKKTYLALVHGRMKQESGRIQLPVARDRVRRTRMTTRRRDGRTADTAYRMLECREGFSLLEVDLHTGRTHQIRVHLAALGRPVVGDKLYGASGTLRWGNRSRPTLNRNFLHAAEIEFLLPGTGKPKKVQAPMPEELHALLREMGFRYGKMD